MSKVLEAARSHYKGLLSNGLRGPVRVPEWDNAEVWFKASSNFLQESKIVELNQQGKTVEALITSLIIRALDADGKPLFNATDKPELMREVDPGVVLRVLGEMNVEESTKAAETALGN